VNVDEPANQRLLVNHLTLLSQPEIQGVLLAQEGFMEPTNRVAVGALARLPGPPSAAMDDRRALKLGGVLAILGGAGYLTAILLHGDLPDATAEATLGHIAGRPEWRLLKLALIASVLCWVGAFAALLRSMDGGLSDLLGRWALASLTIGVAIVVVEYAIIGHALKGIADAWQSATRDDAADHVRMAEVLLSITGGLFHSFVAWLLGSAVRARRSRGRRRAGLPALAGRCGGSGRHGVARGRHDALRGVDLVPYPLLYGGFVGALDNLARRHGRSHVAPSSR